MADPVAANVDPRNHDASLYDEAYRLLDLLREKVAL